MVQGFSNETTKSSVFVIDLSENKLGLYGAFYVKDSVVIVTV